MNFVNAETQAGRAEVSATPEAPQLHLSNGIVLDTTFGTRIPSNVQPFMDIGKPAYLGSGRFGILPYSRLGPATDRTIPIQLRKYHPYADSMTHFPIPRVERVVVIDTSTMEHPEPDYAMTQASLHGRTQIFSILTARPPDNSITLFPGLVYPNQSGPLDFPSVTAKTIGDRFEQIRQARHAIHELFQEVRTAFPYWLVQELDDAKMVLYTLRDNKLRTKYVDRADFFRGMHAIYNPLVTSTEATFFRGAAYAYYRFRQDSLADTIDQVLRTPHYDHNLCRELLELGCLDTYDMPKEIQAYNFIRDYEEYAKGDEEPEPYSWQLPSSTRENVT